MTASPGAARNAPVVVLTSEYSGAERLRSLLSANPCMECTMGTGILQLCDQAAVMWRRVEGRAPSPLADASIRAMAAKAITIMLARNGGQRWCEFALAQPSAAETFMRLFPETKILCLHRTCPDVIHAALNETQWGLSNPALAPFITAYPASTVAALAAHWAARAEQLIAFEDAHADVCRRIRYEDLVAHPREETAAVLDFLGAGHEPATPPWADATVITDPPGCGTGLPADRIPPPLLAQVNTLMSRLGYPLIGSVKGGFSGDQNKRSGRTHPKRR
jgi:hypothetical protein